MSERVIADLSQIVGAANVRTSPSDLESYGRDWTRLHTPKPLLAVLPGDTAEVSRVVQYCHTHRLSMVPSGGRTGLAGGAVATQGEVVVVLDRLNKIEKIDTIGLTAVVQAGVTTEGLQDAAREAGVFFPLDLAAKGSCQIGGNIATNAGGVKFIRFGGMREQVLGLEVVLADGRVLDMNTGLRKNNTGYDLKHLFIGSEGTLGIVTKATVKLAPALRNLQVAVAATASFARIPQILAAANLAGVQLSAFEFFTRKAHEIVLQHARGARTPFAEIAPYYVLLECEEGPGGAGVLEGLLSDLLEQGLIDDAVLAQSPTQFKELWGLRENITESIAAHGHARKNDIALEIDRLAAFIQDLEVELARAPKDIELVLFGHIGDGNLHINYVAPKSEVFADFQKRARAIEERVFALLARHKGSISAEHGIGLNKKHDLSFSRSPDEIFMMKQFKKVLDPLNLMNPGKIFDL